MPVAFLPHGGGPWPFVDLGMGAPDELEGLAGYLRAVRGLPSAPPKALLVISAHWEEAVPTVTAGAHPPLLFDYYGFPPEAYEITWPAPGDPVLATRVRSLLEDAGFRTNADPNRGYDHGTFVPLKVTFPDADVPVVQLSLIRGLDPAKHIAMGRALAPLREEGVFILGSGMTYHDLKGFFSGAGGDVSEAFDAWLRETGEMEPAARDQRLVNWEAAPSARQAHPREEHLLPMMVVAGAAGEDQGRVAYAEAFMGVRLSAYHFG
jgi:aromatic ring-opening dioxygenase catalytic subunit (LigB family)